METHSFESIKQSEHKAYSPVSEHEFTKIRKQLGQTIYNLRKTTRVSQTKLGEVLSLHQTAICRIEQGTQNLTPSELYLLSQFFDVKIDSLLVGDIDYWIVAERFSQTPPFPERYRIYPYSKLREVLPVLEYIKNTHGVSNMNKILGKMNLNATFLINPDQKVGAYCHLDILKDLIQKGLLNTQNLDKVISYTRTMSVQGFLHNTYIAQTSSLNLLFAWILNLPHYETNFKYDVLECNKQDSCTIAVTPADHMKDVSYKDDILGDFLCQYRKKYFMELPRYIGKPPLQLVEKECHFHGHPQCVYELSSLN